MSADTVVTALRNAVAIDKDGINHIADLLEQLLDRNERLKAENERLKNEKPVLCGECIYSSWAEENTASDCPMNLFRLAMNFGNTDVKRDDYCSYGKRRDAE